MCVPLRDQYNKVRYFLGAQLDITGLVDDCTELESLRRLVDQQSKQPRKGSNGSSAPDVMPNDAFEQLGETFNSRELEVLLKLRRRLNPDVDRDEGSGENFVLNHTPAVTSQESMTNLNSIFQLNGQGSAPPLGFYQNVSYHVHDKLRKHLPIFPVSASPTTPFPSHSLRFPRPTSRGNTTSSINESDWRQPKSPRRPRACS
jgi:hypothetical protein